MTKFAQDTFALRPMRVGPKATVPIKLVWHASRGYRRGARLPAKASGACVERHRPPKNTVAVQGDLRRSRRPGGVPAMAGMLDGTANRRHRQTCRAHRADVPRAPRPARTSRRLPSRHGRTRRLGPRRERAIARSLRRRARRASALPRRRRSGSEVSIRSLRLMAASASAIAPSNTPTTMATNASNSACGPIAYDTPATSKVSRMPSSATASSRSNTRGP